VGKTITSMERHTLSVAATGSGLLTYQWYTGVSGDMSAPISGATANVYTPPASSVTQSYWVRVSSPVAAGWSGSTTWETLSETGPVLTVPVPTTPTYFIGSAVSGDAIATTNQVAVTLLDRPPLTSISRRREYGTTFRLTAKVTMTETSSYAYRWYEGALGNTSKIIGYSDYVFVTPTSPVTYWVRVTDDDTGCYSDMADSF
jgi:hypothetical protein